MQRRPNVMQHDFAKIPVPEQLPRTHFAMPYTNKTTFDVGGLVPVFVVDTLPGDTWKIRGNFLARLATLKHPVMSNMFLDVHWFYQPMRTLWDNFRSFIGEVPNDGDVNDNNLQTDDWLVPQLNLENGYIPDALSLFDYFGLPLTGYPTGSAPTSLIFRMYHRIWNWWYRDRNWMPALDVPRGDGPDDPDTWFVTLNQRARRFDYFTQALPWPQRGDSVVIGLGTTAPVIGNGDVMGFTRGTTTRFGLSYNGISGVNLYTDFNGVAVSTGNVTVGTATPTGGTSTAQAFGLSPDAANSGVIADLSSASAITINAFREAVAQQHFLERDARIGNRYSEIILGRFGIDVQDYMIQEPEFLGSQTVQIDVRSVAQTSPTSGSNALGSLGAFSVTGLKGVIEKTTLEHGYIMGIASARVDQIYQYGMRKMWSKRHLAEFYDHSFAHLGEQPLLNKEFWFSNNSTLNESVWGYIPRFDEYRHVPSQVTALFRSSHPQTLDSWHFAHKMTANELPAVYMYENSAEDVDRAIAVSTEPHIILDMFLDIDAYRPIPAYATPGLRRL